MDIFAPITKSQKLIAQLSSIIDNAEIHDLLNELEKQLTHIKLNTSTLQQRLTNISSKDRLPQESLKPEIKSACYVFAGEKGFFCPQCYDNHNTKVPTTRINSKLRVCPACKASLK